MNERDPNRGACFWCRWIDIDRRWMCAHPRNPTPIKFLEARELYELCGPIGRWWEPRLELES